MGNILKMGKIIMLDITNLDKLFEYASGKGITKRQIGIVCYGKSWRSIYKAKAQDARIIKRNKRIIDAINKILEAHNA